MAGDKKQDDEHQTSMMSARILFFIEKKSYLQHFKKIFRMCGLESVQEATSLPEAINFLISKNYDLIIITHLGQASEADLLIEELKGIEGTAGLPLAVITTTQGGVKNILSLYSKGIDEVMVSPLSFKIVENTVSRLLKKRQGASADEAALIRAEEFLALGEYDKARDGFKALTDKDACLFEANLGFYRVCRQEKQWQPAVLHLKRAFEIAKTRNDETLLGKAKLYRDLATVYHYFADYYQQRGQMEKALKNYRFSIKLNPFHIDSIIAILGFMRSADEADNIAGLLQDITQNFVPFSEPLEKIGVELDKLADKFVNLNMFDNALAIHRQLASIDHGNAAVCIKNADFLLEQGEISAVVEMLIRVSDKITDYDVLVKAAHIFMDVEKRHYADRVLTPSADESGKNPDLAYFKAMGRDELITRAKEMFQQALLIEPDSTECWVDILICYLRREEDEKASELADKLARNHPDDEELMGAIIEAMLDNNAFAIAAPYLKNALERFPQNSRFYEQQAVFYKAQNKPYDAISFLKKAHSIQPDRTELLILLAETYNDIQDYGNAIIFFEKAAEQGSEDPRVEDGLHQALRAKQKAASN